ncbi:MAG: potassium-transporting ATPase subunit KdpA [Rickettsiales bacterium]
MNSIIYITLCFAVILLSIKPLGVYVGNVFTGRNIFTERILGGFERLIYRICRIDSKKEMDWLDYIISLLIFSLFCFLSLFFILTNQSLLPLNYQNFSDVPYDLAFNVSIGFITNGNWQAYSGEHTLSIFSQAFGLTIHNFLATTSGMSVFAALARSIARKQTNNLGNFYKDTVRGTIYILLPFSLILAVFLASQGAMQNVGEYIRYTPLENSSELNDKSNYLIPQGMVASQVAIKTIGSGGGGFFGVNAAHPFENPTPLSNFVQVITIFLLPCAFIYAFGYMINDRRQGWSLIMAMFIIFIPLLAIGIINEHGSNPLFDKSVIDDSEGNMEGKELRFGVTSSVLWASITAAASNGSANSAHDSFLPLSGLVPMLLIQFSETIFGGVGSGVYNIFVYVIITVFIGGLMIGKNPEYMGKKIDAFDIKMAALVILIPAVLTLFGSAIAVYMENMTQATLNDAAQSLSEILYAFSSASNNNGSAFAGINADNTFYNVMLGISMFVSRFWVMIAIMALAGSLSAKNITPKNEATLPTHTPLFIFLLVSVLIIIGILTYVPAVALGPVAEHYSLVNNVDEWSLQK